MRTIAGILCFFLLMYMLTFVQLNSKADGILLVAPGTLSANEWNMHSAWWLALPIIFGVYLLVTGEKDYYEAKEKKKRKAEE